MTYEPLGGDIALGNLIWKDADADGSRDAGEEGIAGVSLSLFSDSNANGVLDAEDTLLGTITSDANGLYSFTGLVEGNYIVRVDASNFEAGGALDGMASSPGGSDPDDNIDFDDNGIPDAGFVTSSAITLSADSEPTPGDGNNTNNTLDFGFVDAGNDAPVVQDDAFINDGVQTLSGNLFDDNGSGADSDPDGPPLAISAVNGNGGDVGVPITLASGAQLTVNSDGTFSYEPNVALQVPPTSDSFTYTLAGGDTATVSLTIENENAIIGDDDNNRLVGGAGNDAIYGLDGADHISGFNGDDLISGGDGEYDRAGWYQTDEALGGATVNLTIQGAQDTGSQGWDTIVGIEYLSGTPFADTLIGDENDNWLWGSGIYLFGEVISTTNNDTLDGGDGDDLLTVGAGNHVLTGGNGNDSVNYTENGGTEVGITLNLNLSDAQATGAGSWILTGVENLSGGDGNDNFQGNGSANVLAGEAGSDILNGGGGDDTLYGDGSIGIQHITGSTGPITMSAEDSRSVNEAADGDDALNGGGGNDTLYGGGGNDVLRGAADNDTLYGGLGDDLLVGGFGDDVIDGGDGYDRAGNYHTDETLGGVTVDLNIVGPQDTGSQGWDTLTSIEYLSGTPFADTLIGDTNDNILWGSVATIDPGTNWVSTSNNDTLDGGEGNDLLVAGIGNHILTGGGGVDTVGFTENWGDDPAIRISLALQGAPQDTGQGLWTLTGIENLSGGDDNDELTGDDSVNILAGSFGNDILSGGDGNDTLYGDGLFDSGAPGSGPITLFPDVGANGNDLLEGGLGNDSINGGGGIDTASYAHALGSVTVTLNNNTTGNGSATGADGADSLFGIENVIGSDFNDTITGSAAANVIEGGAGNDFLQARGGDDVVYGGTGNDYLGGGIGNDYLDGGDGWDRASFANGSSGPVTVDLRLQGTAQNTGLGVDTLIGIENVTGTAFGDTLIGDDVDNWLWGGTDAAGVTDTIDGQGGNDLIDVGAGNHVVSGGTGTDTFLYNPFAIGSVGVSISLALQGAAQDTGAGIMTLDGFENLSGGDFNDSLTGDDGVNILAGAGGNDNLTGGVGNDTLYGDGWFGTSSTSPGQITIYPDIAVLGGIDGDDLLEGGLGDDQLYGGGGNDTASYANASGAVEAFLYDGSFGEAEGADGYDQLNDMENLTGSANDDILGGNSGANVLDGGGGDDTIRGNAGNDTLFGSDGNDYLGGGAGDDFLDGGDGFDRVSYFNGSIAGVIVDLRMGGPQDTGLGIDTLVNVEHLSGTGFSDTLTGDSGDNWLWGTSDGSAGDDTLDGQGGNDLLQDGAGNHTIFGGVGIDTFSFITTETTSGINVSLALQGAAQNTGVGLMTLSGIENLSGSIYGDTLVGDGGSNVLAGGDGADTLVGGAGNDSLYGDGFFGIDGNGGSGPITLYTDADAANGEVGGNDLLEGGLGNDQLYGGLGNDTASYMHASSSVTVTLTSAGGSATGSDGSDTLFSIENVTGGAFNDTITGNAAGNVLTGGLGNDSLNGGGGNDTLIGGGGNDKINGGAGVDVIDYSGSASGVSVNLSSGKGAGGDASGDTYSNLENILGSAFDDKLVGSSAANVINGGAGNDIITGGGGADSLFGGSGNDSFVFVNVADIGMGGNSDTLMDFEAGGSTLATRADLIDLGAIDANSKSANKDDPFVFIGSSQFSNKPGQLRYDATTNTLSGDINGDGVADFSLVVMLGGGTLDGSDFIL